VEDMSIDFNADDIFGMAEQIERNGAMFYRKAAGNIQDQNVKEVLLDLAVMEDEHLKTFTKMKQDLLPDEKKPTAFDPDDLDGLYLKAMADGRVFNVKANPAAELTGDETSLEIVSIAIGLEKESIVFYLGLKKLVPENKGRDKLDDIIQEEMRHIAILSNWLNP
jgi:rubrerythrin